MINNEKARPPRTLTTAMQGMLRRVNIRPKSDVKLTPKQQKDYKLVKKILAIKVPNRQVLKDTIYQDCKSYQDCLEVITKVALEGKKIPNITNNQFKGFLKDNQKELQAIFEDLSDIDKSTIIDQLILKLYSKNGKNGAEDQSIKQKFKTIIEKIITPKGRTVISGLTSSSKSSFLSPLSPSFSSNESLFSSRKVPSAIYLNPLD